MDGDDEHGDEGGGVDGGCGGSGGGGCGGGCSEVVEMIITTAEPRWVGVRLLLDGDDEHGDEGGGVDGDCGGQRGWRLQRGGEDDHNGD
ncbi:hypothetical protein Tco_1054503 [Tanacetum coccineum]|uniref:Uncharacterized protein n=1 Tax=Tanacetum coccineum TaxID=301880 RepID=A0ABQ5GWY4_9ASTR